MDINDYLIDQAGQSWSELLADWNAVLPPPFTLWLVNRFGDAIVVLNDESIHLLDVGAGRSKRIADNRDHFVELLGVEDNVNDWLMCALVDRCVAAGMKPGPNQCYGYKVPPMLGGEYDAENIELTDLSVHYSLLAQLHQKTKDLADGTKIGAVTID